MTLNTNKQIMKAQISALLLVLNVAAKLFKMLINNN